MGIPHRFVVFSYHENGRRSRAARDTYDTSKFVPDFLVTAVHHGIETFYPVLGALLGETGTRGYRFVRVLSIGQ
jgi:hypothetical protein